MFYKAIGRPRTAAFGKDDVFTHDIGLWFDLWY
ncbi:unnamed protein product, partial [marine sediment metagenome]